MHHNHLKVQENLYNYIKADMSVWLFKNLEIHSTNNIVAQSQTRHFLRPYPIYTAKFTKEILLKFVVNEKVDAKQKNDQTKLTHSITSRLCTSTKQHYLNTTTQSLKSQ